MSRPQSQNGAATRQFPRFLAAAVTILVFAAVIFYSIVLLGAPPHVAMLLGCGIAAAAAMICGSKWAEVENGLIQGISQALSSLVILILIGLLIGVWIEAGVVPTLICYGLKLLSPRFFLLGAMLTCSVISMAVGSWGTAGTVGLALMGVAQVMGIPAPMAAGAIISGAYLGDKVSPLSDSTNLASSVTGVDVFSNVRYMFPVAGAVYLIACLLYFLLGTRYGGDASSTASIAALGDLLRGTFHVTVWNLLPMAALVTCVLLKVPAIPSVFAGILCAAATGMALQGCSVGELFSAAYSGHISQTGNQVIDGLLTAGGLESMLYSVSLILCAMMFGGIMEGTGLMEALMRPLFRLIHKRGTLIASTVAICVFINLVLPEQYIAIALPGRMFAAEYDRHGVNRKDLTRALGAGGASVSPLVPWNTCGVFMSGVLGISTYAYFPYTFLNLMMPFAVVLVGFITARAEGKRQATAP